MGSNLLFSRTPYIAERFNVHAFRIALSELLHQESFDIIQLEGPYPGLYLDLIRSVSKAKVSLRAHNVEHLLWQRKASHENSLPKKWYLNNMARRLKRLELEVAGRADFLIPISDCDASYFTKQGLQKPFLTIPAGLDLKDYPFTELPAAQDIFFIGALDWLPNQEGTALVPQTRCFPSAAGCKLPGLRFHVAGRNASKHFQKKLNHPKITYHGEVRRCQGFMQAHRVMVAPLLSGSGIRIKIIEAMALGRPVVTTSAGIEGIELRNHPQVAVVDEPYLFSSQIVKLLTDPRSQDQALREARTFISRNFDTFELSNRLSRFYKTEV